MNGTQQGTFQWCSSISPPWAWTAHSSAMWWRAVWGRCSFCYYVLSLPSAPSSLSSGALASSHSVTAASRWGSSVTSSQAWMAQEHSSGLRTMWVWVYTHIGWDLSVIRVMGLTKSLKYTVTSWGEYRCYNEGSSLAQSYFTQTNFVKLVKC